MAFGVESTSFSSANPDADGVFTISHTLTAANKLIVTTGSADGGGTNRDILSVTWHSVAMSQVVEMDDSSFEHVSIWELHNPDLGTFSVVVTTVASPSSVDQIGVGATGFLEAATALGTPNTNSGSGANPSVTVVDSASGDIVVSCLASDVGPQSVTTEAGTLVWEVEDIGNDSDFNVQRQNATGASTVCSWTSDAPPAGGWAACGVAVKAFTEAISSSTLPTARTQRIQPLDTDEDSGRFDELDVRNWW